MRYLKFLALAAFCSSLNVLAQDKMAFVNMEAVFQGFYKTNRSDAAFKKQKDLYNEHAENLTAEIELLKKQRDENQEKALNIAFSEEARQQHRKAAEEKNAFYQEKQAELKDFLRNTERELQKRYLELRSEIVKEISELARQYAKEQGYSVLMDSSGLTRNYIPVVLYYPEENDVTEELLKELNRGHEDEVAASEENQADKGNGVE